MHTPRFFSQTTPKSSNSVHSFPLVSARLLESKLNSETLERPDRRSDHIPSLLSSLPGNWSKHGAEVGNFQETGHSFPSLGHLVTSAPRNETGRFYVSKHTHHAMCVKIHIWSLLRLLKALFANFGLPRCSWSECPRSLPY